MQKKNLIDMTNGPIFSKLLIFSVPIIFSGILQMLFHAADVIVVGQFAGDASLAAVGSTSSLIHLTINLFVGLATGTNVVSANYFGAGDKKSLKETVHTAMLLSLISGIFLTGFGVVFAKQVLKLMQAPDEVLNLATLYLKIYFGGITFTMIYNFGSALLRSKGDTRRPLYILFTAGLINVLLNILFVVKFRMGVAGVGSATVLSQAFSAVMVVILLIKEQDDFKLNLRFLHLNRTILIKIIKVGVPAGFQGMMFSFSNVVIQSSVNSFGAILIAGSSASSSIENFVYTSMNGFAQGTLTFTSQNYGAKKYNRIRNTALISELIVFLVGFILGYSVVLFGKDLLKLYTSNPETIAAGFERLFIICSTYFLCGMMDVIGNIIRGIGHSVLPMIASMAGACGFRILWLMTVFRMEQFHKPSMIFITYPLSWILTFLAELICFIVLFKKMKQNEDI